jgi:hypothetical protein
MDADDESFQVDPIFLERVPVKGEQKGPFGNLGF